MAYARHWLARPDSECTFTAQSLWGWFAALPRDRVVALLDALEEVWEQGAPAGRGLRRAQRIALALQAGLAHGAGRAALRDRLRGPPPGGLPAGLAPLARPARADPGAAPGRRALRAADPRPDPADPSGIHPGAAGRPPRRPDRHHRGPGGRHHRQFRRDRSGAARPSRAAWPGAADHRRAARHPADARAQRPACRPSPISSASARSSRARTTSCCCISGATWRRKAAAAPRLLLCGRRGWENENVLDLLERCEALRGLVLELGTLPDSRVTELLAGARALLFPSFAEGYGLPVAEALALGVPVLCSDLRGAARGRRRRSRNTSTRSTARAGGAPSSTMPGRTARRRAAQLDRLRHWRTPGWDDAFRRGGRPARPGDRRAPVPSLRQPLPAAAPGSAARPAQARRRWAPPRHDGCRRGAARRRRPERAIAIVGAACRLPGRARPRRLLAPAGRRPGCRRHRAGGPLHAALSSPIRAAASRASPTASPPGTLGDVAGFDPGAFGISPREAVEMDPQQRLLLEVAAEALEDAGMPPGALAGSGTGVFVGGSLTDYSDLRRADIASGDRYFMTGGALSILANRIGNVFDLRGPAQTIDTACSSSLVALHWACEALRAGRIPAALVGGVNLLLSPYPFLGFARAGMLSPSGRCHAFDARADGYVRAEGAGMVLLKPLDDALAAGDAIRGVILASGVNAAGRTIGISLPNQAAQQALLEQVLAEAGDRRRPHRLFRGAWHRHRRRRPDRGRRASARRSAARRTRRGAADRLGQDQYRPYRTGLRHGRAAQGHAGAAEGRGARRRCTTRRRTRRSTSPASACACRPRLEALPRPPPRGGRGQQLRLRRHQCLRRCSARRRCRPPAARCAGPATAAAAAALGPQRGRRWRPWRRAGRRPLAATAAPALPALLRGAARHRGPAAAPAGPARRRCRGAGRRPRRLAGRGRQGAAGRASRPAAPGAGHRLRLQRQWRALRRHGAGRSSPPVPAFAAGVAAADAALAPLLGWSVAANASRPASTAEALAASDIAQPLLFAVQHGIVAALAAQGIRPALCLGHSVGEVAAAAAAGMLDLATAARLVVARSRHQATRRAARAAWPRSARRPRRRCRSSPRSAHRRRAGIEIAAINAPESADRRRAGEALLAPARGGGGRAALELPRPRPRLCLPQRRHGRAARRAAGRPRRPRRARPRAVPLISTVTGAALDPARLRPGALVAQPARAGAIPRRGAGRRAQHGPCLFLEIGPHRRAAGLPARRRCGPPASEAAILPACRAATRPPTPSPASPTAPGPPAPIRAAAPPSPARPARAACRYPLRPPAPSGTPTTRRPRAGIAPVEDHPLLGFRQGAEPGLWIAPYRHRAGALAGRPPPGRGAGAAGRRDVGDGAGRRPRPPPGRGGDRAARGRRSTTPCRWRRAMRGSCAQRSTAPAASPWNPAAAWRPSPGPCISRRRVATLPALPEAAPAAPLRGTPLEGEAIRALAASAGLHYGPAFESLDHAVIDERRRPRRRAAAPARRRARRMPASCCTRPGWTARCRGWSACWRELPAEPGTGLVPVRVARLVCRRRRRPGRAIAEIRLASRGERSASADLLLRDAAGRAGGGAGSLHPAAHPPARPHRPGRGRLPRRAGPRRARCPARTPPAPADLAACLEAARRQDEALDLGDAAILLEGYCAAAAHAALCRRARQPGRRPAPCWRNWPRAASPRRARPASARCRPPDLPPAVEIWRQVLLEQPALAPDLAWVALAAERLPQALLDWQAPADPALAAGPPAGSAGQARLGSVLAEAVAAFAAAWPRGLPLRVLEVGAGPGPLTARLAAALAASGRHVRFTAAALPGRPGAGLAGRRRGAGLRRRQLGPARRRSRRRWPPTWWSASASAPGCAPAPCCRRRCARPPPPAPRCCWPSRCPARCSISAAARTRLVGRARRRRPAGAGGLGRPRSPPPAGRRRGPRRCSAAPWPALLLAARAPEGAAVLAAPKLRRIALFGDAAMGSLPPALAAVLQARGATVVAARPGGGGAHPARRRCRAAWWWRWPAAAAAPASSRRR